jgi:hypothetical protein
LHVRLLHHPSREALLQIEVEADQGEHDLNRPGALIGILSCIGIYDVLMQERWIRVGKRIERQLVEPGTAALLRLLPS